MKKVEINFIYSHQKTPVKIYSDDDGEIWRTNKRDPNKINVALGINAAKNLSFQDSLLALEPACICPRDYSETNVKRFKKVFSWCRPAMRKHKNFIPINHPSWDPPPKFKDLVRPPWKERDGIVIVSNNKKSKHHSQIYDLRTKLADYLHDKGNNVSWYGNIPLDRPYFKGPVDNKLDVIRKAKFCICPENCYDSTFSWGYLSEKLPDAWFGGAVPIYMGCYNINDFNFPKTSYIDLREHVTKNNGKLKIYFSQINKVIKSYDSVEYGKMIDASNQIMQSKKGLYHVISSDRAHRIIIESFL